MARITVEDCAEVVKNRFELVLFAAERTKAIASGSPITINKNNDKVPVIALRELAGRKVSPAALKEKIIERHQKKAIIDPAEIKLARERQSEIADELSANSFGVEEDILELEGITLEDSNGIIDDEE